MSFPLFVVLNSVSDGSCWEWIAKQLLEYVSLESRECDIVLPLSPSDGNRTEEAIKALPLPQGTRVTLTSPGQTLKSVLSLCRFSNGCVYDACGFMPPKEIHRLYGALSPGVDWVRAVREIQTRSVMQSIDHWRLRAQCGFRYSDPHYGTFAFNRQAVDGMSDDFDIRRVHKTNFTFKEQAVMWMAAPDGGWRR